MKQNPWVKSGNKVPKMTLIILLGAALFMLLFLNYKLNLFHLISSQWFDNWKGDFGDSSEKIVTDSLLGAREHGLGYSYGLMGSYVKQIGLQGILLRIIDVLIPRHELSVSFFKGIFVFIYCALILYLTYWSWKEFGLGAAVALYLGFFFNRWVIVSCSNLYWASFTFLLPFVSILMLCKKEENDKKSHFGRFFAVTFFSIFVRAACGFEMISTVMILAEIPAVYYMAKDILVNEGNGLSVGKVVGYEKGNSKRIKRFLAIALGSICAFISALLINFVQQAFYFSSIQSAINNIIYTISKRTGAFNVSVAPIYIESLEASKLSVVQQYFINGEPLIATMHMAAIALIFMIATTCCFIGSRYSPTIEKNRGKLQALSVALWISFFGPLSWYILAAPHSYIHTTINYILWSYPCLFIGSILCGSIVSALLIDWKSPLKKCSKVALPVLIIIVLYFYADTFKVGQHYLGILPKNGIEIEANAYANVYYYDSSLYFLVPAQNRSEKFFLHLYTNDKAEGVNEYGFVNEDFEFKQNELKTYPWEDRKIARVPLNAEYSINTISMGQYNTSGDIWEKKFDLWSTAHPSQAMTPYDLSDDNWINGISRDGTRILLEPYDISIKSLKGKTIKMHSGEQVKVADVEKADNWFHIILDKPISCIDGYPNYFEVLN